MVSPAAQGAAAEVRATPGVLRGPVAGSLGARPTACRGGAREGLRAEGGGRGGAREQAGGQGAESARRRRAGAPAEVTDRRRGDSLAAVWKQQLEPPGSPPA